MTYGKDEHGGCLRLSLEECTTMENGGTITHIISGCDKTVKLELTSKVKNKRFYLVYSGAENIGIIKSNTKDELKEKAKLLVEDRYGYTNCEIKGMANHSPSGKVEMVIECVTDGFPDIRNLEIYQTGVY